MGKLVVMENLSLDGVMQAPGRADEDRRGRFEHGGWAIPYRDAVMGQVMAGGMTQVGPLLFGRRTYEDFFKAWHGRTDNPFSPVLEAAPKYVASTTLAEPLPWNNSTLLTGDAARAVEALKQGAERDILLMGSGVLAETLLQNDLVDEYVLLIHPLVLGTGRRLFADAGKLSALRLIDATPTTTGVVIARYSAIR